MARPLHTVALLGTMRTLLFIFNIVFWLSGVSLVCVGVWVALRLRKYLELDNEDELADALSIAFLGGGAAIIVVASIACQCAVKGSAPRIYAYSFFLLLTLALEMAILGFGYRGRTAIDQAFHEGLSRGLQEYGKDTERTSAVDDIQVTIECCGVTNYSDWLVTPWGLGHGGNKLPHSCCTWTPDGVCGGPELKDRWPMMHPTGCYRKVMDFLVDNIHALGVGLALIGLVHGLGVVLACCLARRISKAEYEEIRDRPSSGKQNMKRQKKQKKPKTTSELKGSSDAEDATTECQQMMVVETDSARSPASSKPNPPPLVSLQTLQMSKQKLKPASASNKAKKNKNKQQQQQRAKSIDWTNQMVKSDDTASSVVTTSSCGGQQHMLTSAQINNVVNHGQQQQQPAEDYYSVPRKCQRAMSSNFLDQHQHQHHDFHSPASWADPSQDPFHFSVTSVPQPPSSPPPSPPYANRAMWTIGPGMEATAAADYIGRADSMQDMSRYYH